MNKEQQIEEMKRAIDECCHDTTEEQCDCCSQCSTCMATAMYEAGYRKQEWISVDERLPDRCGKYLVFTFDNRVFVCHFADYYCNGDLQFDDYKVTHWMQLPKPPRKEGE